MPGAFTGIATPFDNMLKSASDWVGAQWGSGKKDVQQSSFQQFMAIDANNRAGQTAFSIPGFGPQVPSYNLGVTTNAIPGSIYDTGFAHATVYDGGANGLAFGAFPGAAARATTDLNALPYRPKAPSTVPISLRVSQWWHDVTSSFAAPAGKMDAPTKPTQSGAPSMLAIAAIGLVGTVAAVAIMRKH